VSDTASVEVFSFFASDLLSYSQETLHDKQLQIL